MSDRPNRRQAARWKAQLKCRFECRGQPYDGRLFDLSEKGAFLESRQFLPALQSRLAIRFRSLDGQRELSATAVVRHCRSDRQGNPEGFGVEFEQLSPDVLSELELIVTQPTFLRNRK